MKTTSWFFIKLWRLDRGLWWVLVGYCSISGAMHLAGVQVSPFYLWAMYSQRVLPQAQYEGIEIRDERGDTVHFTRLPHSTMHMITVPTEYALEMEAVGGEARLSQWMRQKLGDERYSMFFEPVEAALTNDSADMLAHIHSLKGYIGRATGRTPLKLEIARCAYIYAPETGTLLQTDKKVVWYE